MEQEIINIATVTANLATSQDIANTFLTKQQFFEILGYVGSLVVAISLSFSSIWKMRIYNFLGCLLFTIYGLCIGAIPLAIANGYIALLDAYHIINLLNDQSRFSLDELGNIGETYFKKFYNFYEDDIRAYFPDVTYMDLEKNETYIMFRDMIPVGIFSIIPNIKENKAEILMEYVIPKFRDAKFGAYLYNKKAYLFTDRKILTLEATSKVIAHQEYLKKVGFTELEEKKDGLSVFSKKL